MNKRTLEQIVAEVWDEYCDYLARVEQETPEARTLTAPAFLWRGLAAKGVTV